jgi:CelD/BcsL family acetyltransferase involved in cellulose biosynthesis
MGEITSGKPWPTSITVSCHDRFAFGELEAEWPALLRRAGHDRPFYQHEVLRVWMDNFAAASPVHVIVARDAAGLRAALPCIGEWRRFRGLPVHVLRGTASVYSERFDLIARRGDTEAIAAIWRHLQERDDWQVLELPDVPVPDDGDDEGAAFGLLEQAGREVPTGSLISKHVPFLRLPGRGQDLAASLAPDFRRELRRRGRRLAERGAVTIEHVTGGDDLEARLEEGFAVEAASWKGREGTAIAADPALRAYYAELAREAALRGYLSLRFLRCGGRAIAFHYGLEHGGRYYLPKLGVDDAWRPFGPGHLLLQAVAQDGLERGLLGIDLLGEAMAWKLAWTPSTREHRWCYVFRGGALGRVLHAAKLGPVSRLAAAAWRGLPFTTPPRPPLERVAA